MKYCIFLGSIYSGDLVPNIKGPFVNNKLNFAIYSYVDASSLHSCTPIFLKRAEDSWRVCIESSTIAKAVEAELKP
jgi:hypothetical protein